MNQPIILLLALAALLGTAAQQAVGAAAAAPVVKNPLVVGLKGSMTALGPACPPFSSPIAFPEFATGGSNITYTVAWANDSVTAVSIPLQVAGRVNARKGVGRGWGVAPTSMAQWMAQLPHELAAASGQPVSRASASIAQDLIDLLANELFNRSAYNAVAGAALDQVASDDDGVGLIQWAADFVYTKARVIRSPNIPADVVASYDKATAIMKLFRTMAASSASAKVKAHASYRDFLALVPELGRVLENASSLQPYCGDVSSFLTAIATRDLKQVDRIISITMTTNTTGSMTKLLPSVKSWLSGTSSALRVYVSGDLGGFDQPGCVVTDASLKVSLNGVPLFSTPLGNPTFTPTQVQQLTWNASDAGQASVTKTVLAAINGATALTTKVEFKARFGAKCLPVLSSLTIAESMACSPTASPALDVRAFEELMDEAAAAFSQQDAFEGSLADFSFDSAFDQALFEDSLDEGLDYLEI
ncbi:hypothetical protein H9P43_002074 [Blastocladiella emersonii ATCC 22665]|nr:hypothetical protein H9P43_002074 [Blastocladiella emersonii ATCC 22665]